MLKLIRENERHIRLKSLIIIAKPNVRKEKFTVYHLNRIAIRAYDVGKFSNLCNCAQKSYL